MAEKNGKATSSVLRPLIFLSAFAVPVVIAAVVYRLDGFTAAPLPEEYDPFSRRAARVPETNNRILEASEKVGEGSLLGPEDVVYDSAEAALYTGCSDGWIKRVSIAAGTPTVEDWVFVGGRPLGVAFRPSDGSLVVAEADKGLLLVRKDGMVELLAEAADGLRFGLIDGVDVAVDGTVYFTDATHKYHFGNYMLDFMEGRPHGRLMKFDPIANHTTVILRDLYFPNGVAMAPDQRSLIFCETLLRMCKRYHITGEKKGEAEMFVDNLPGYPDNIRYDGEGRYWIGFPSGRTLFWDVVFHHPTLRKLIVVLSRFVAFPSFHRDGGVLAVGLAGEPLALYNDPALSRVSGGLKVGAHLYYGSLVTPYLSRIQLITKPETAAAA